MLSVRNLSIEIEDENSSETVVHDFNMEMNKGDIIGIVGESGSGKTMTALAIAGLLRRHDMKKKGEIIFEDINLLECDRRILRKIQGNEISMIFQEPMSSLNPIRKIGWQVEESLRIHTDMDKEERRESALKALANVELHDPEQVYNSYPHELSGGMRQRVMIAAAMISEPEILIADEPTTALDVTIQAEIVELLRRINQERETAILFISHDLGLVNTLCHKVIVMQDGHIVEKGICNDVFLNPKMDYTKNLIASIPKNPFFS